MTPRFAINRRNKTPAVQIVPPSGNVWSQEDRGHWIRGEVAFVGTGNGNGKHGEPARQTVHVTPYDFIFFEEIRVVSVCKGSCLCYAGPKKKLDVKSDATASVEVTALDYPIETNGSRSGKAFTETQKIQVEVWARKPPRVQWESIAEFPLTLEVEFPQPPKKSP